MVVASGSSPKTVAVGAFVSPNTVAFESLAVSDDPVATDVASEDASLVACPASVDEASLSVDATGVVSRVVSVASVVTSTLVD
ncbi:hypothetical protein EFL50_05015 [Weissella cibaria]|nr:hypothetical protein [Weissella cibaria]